MNIDIRDILLVLNAITMVGGAFAVVAMLRNEVRHLTIAVQDLKEWLKGVESRLREVEIRTGSPDGR